MKSLSTSRAFQKTCPHCRSAVFVRDLRKVARRVSRRWYQFTPAPHTACPLCGGYVIFTIVNSPLVIIPMLLVLGVLFGTMAVPAVGVAIHDFPGGSVAVELTVVSISVLVLWFAVRRARLIPEVLNGIDTKPVRAEDRPPP